VGSGLAVYWTKADRGFGWMSDLKRPMPSPIPRHQRLIVAPSASFRFPISDKLPEIHPSPSESRLSPLPRSKVVYLRRLFPYCFRRVVVAFPGWHNDRFLARLINIFMPVNCTRPSMVRFKLVLNLCRSFALFKWKRKPKTPAPSD
jgi:hypothetical protein